MVEKPYFSCSIFKKVWFHCCSSKKFYHNSIFVSQTQKGKCRKQNNALETKRKTVLAANLATDCKKSKQMQLFSVFRNSLKILISLKEIDCFGRKENFSIVKISFDKYPMQFCTGIIYWKFNDTFAYHIRVHLQGERTVKFLK